MPQRIKTHLWEWKSGEHDIFGDFIHPNQYYFRGDTMVFSTEKKAIIRYQYFGTLSIKDVDTGIKLMYEMKGTNWFERIRK